MIDVFLGYLNIPDSCKLNKRLFKRLFSENTTLDATDKKALKSDVEEIRWLYTLKTATINIARYANELHSYPEVAILHISLSSSGRINRIAQFIQKAIPYPLILIFTTKERISISICDKRVNQTDKTKWVVSDVLVTELFDIDNPNKYQSMFLEDCNISKLSFKNFYVFYQDFCDRLIALNCADITGEYNLKNRELSKQRFEKLLEISKLKQKKIELKNKIKKEKQVGKQVELNTAIKRQNEKIQNLMVQL